jgi:hypothetical protein
MKFSVFKSWGLTLAISTLFNACALKPNRPHSVYTENSGREEEQKPVVLAQPEKRPYPPANSTDRLIDARTHVLPEVKPATPAGISEKSTEAKSEFTGGPWRIQVGTLSDLESAQIRKHQLDAKLGSPVDMTFDAPYYKLRWGGFATKQEAEDKLLEMSDIFHEAFIIRQ